MKQEIKELRKAQKCMWDNQYPGYPFQLTIVIDLEEKVAWVDWNGKKQPLEKALASIAPSLLYQCLDADNTSKRTFVVDQHLEDYKKYLEYDDDQFYISQTNICRFYFALNSAIYNHKKTDKGFIFACIDDDADYVDVQVFNDLQTIKNYVKDYFTQED